MHNGSIASIANVLDFYDGKGNQAANAELDPAATGLGIGGGGGQNLAEALAFLDAGLTDCRVEHELAPFDHPALTIPDGPSLPAVGAAGNGTICP